MDSIPLIDFLDETPLVESGQGHDGNLKETEGDRGEAAILGQIVAPSCDPRMDKVCLLTTVMPSSANMTERAERSLSVEERRGSGIGR